MNVLAVRNAVEYLAHQCRHGDGGPFALEVATYRYAGHSVSGPGTSYRVREEIQQVRTRRDAIAHFRTDAISAHELYDDVYANCLNQGQDEFRITRIFARHRVKAERNVCDDPAC